MTIQEIRRANLRRWAAAHGVPSKEKSYFSQLLGGTSFGERAARRLEADYGMGSGYLDQAGPILDEAPPAPPYGDRLSPAARALMNAIAEADERGVPADAFNALRETLRFLGQPARPTRFPPGTFDVEDPSH